MAFRVSYFFRQPADLLTGWSCNFWNVLADGSAVETKMLALKDALVAFTGFGTQVTHARVSDLSGFRQAKIYRFNPDFLTDSAPGEFSDYPDTAVLLKLAGPNAVIVNQWIRGLREGQLNDINGKLSFRAADKTKFNAIVAQLTTSSNGWQLRVRDGSQPLKDVVNIADDGIVTVLAHLYKAGDLVRIQRVKGFTYVNAIWKITAVTADTFKVIGWNPPELHDPYLGGGLVRKIVYINVPIQAATADRASSHDSGRPFGLRGGRRRTRRK